LTGTKSDIVYKPAVSDDPMQRKPVIEKAKQVLNWEPRIQLREGLMRTIEYFDSILK
jgi:UDP-glucuronate decarboxylase